MEELLFAAALERDEPARSAFLDEACRGNLELRRRLLALLTASDRTNHDLHLPDEAVGSAGSTTSNSLSYDGIGQTIGPYRLLEKIGEGGCGIVFAAEQLEPVRRQVAVKVIKLGMDTKEVVARFEAERQVLALMDHPHIARVLDAGATGKPSSTDSAKPIPEGRPFFVMELVRGARITNYCDEQRLATRDRLALFIKVCLAIQHAHQKGIIHRDIKPSNILVTVHDGAPVPKVIDFGIAKAIEGRLTDATVNTRLHPFIGTPAYMSPEQADMSNVDVDTRSDIYSLGVLLYELLTGRPPLDGAELCSMGVDAMRQAIRDRDPCTASTTLAALDVAELKSIAERRACESQRLMGLVRGDLDWILMKCLEKDRSRRYATANDLAADIQRHLNNEPVVARPPSTVDRLQKAFRRNRVAYSAAGAVAVALLLGLAGSVWQAVRATRAEALASKRLVESEAITAFLTDVFESADPGRNGREVTVAETLESAAQRLNSSRTNQPARREELRWTLAKTYLALSLAAEAIPLLKQVEGYHLATSGADDRDTLKVRRQLGVAYTALTNIDEALTVQKDLLAAHQRLHGDESPEAIMAMAELTITYSVAQRLETARELGKQALELSRKVNGPEHPDTVFALLALGMAYPDSGGFKVREEAYVLSRKVFGSENKTTLRAAFMLEVSYEFYGHHEERLKLLEWLVPTCLKVFGPNNRFTIRTMSDLEQAYYTADRWQDALQMKADHARWNPRNLDTDLLVVQAWFQREPDYSNSCRRLLKLVEGTPLLTTAERAARAVLLLPASDPAVLEAAYVLARRAVDGGGEHSRPGLCQLALGMAEYRRGNFAKADKALVAAEKEAPIPAGFFRAMSLFRQGQTEKARLLFEGTAAGMPSLPDDDQNPLADGASGNRVTTWLAYREAAQLMGIERTDNLVENWLEDLRRDVAAKPKDHGRVLRLAMVLVWLGKTDEHEQLCRLNLTSTAESKDPLALDRVSKSYLLRPDPNPDTLKLAADMARRALETGANRDKSLPWYRMSVGIAAYREGQFDEAETFLTWSLKNPVNDSQRRVALAFRAMTRWKAGRTNDARSDLAGISAHCFVLPDTVRVTSVIRDPDRLAVRLACQEAARLMNIPTPAVEPR